MEHHVSQLRDRGSGVIARWEDDVQEVLNSQPIGMRFTVRVISDLYFVRDGIEYFFSIKTVKPNIDQTAEAKRDLLKLKVYNPDGFVE
ncbi:TdeIII family type II restriction endonuclease [Serratia symbiotica]|uniref:TdeIII family type II restriction endonuclease n=1 Tax=Serratia symbiotica TaxID=138074 RepID=UPI003D9A1191